MAVTLAVFATASLVHHIHNAEFLAAYVVAPLSAHTPMMHLTIGFEIAAAAALLFVALLPLQSPSGTVPRRR